MEIFDIKDKTDRVFAFEIDNGSIGRKATVDVIRQIPEATVLTVPRSFSSLREDVFCEFEIGGHRFQAWEPFGDNSRYWIGPKDNAWHLEIDIVRNAFVSI